MEFRTVTDREVSQVQYLDDQAANIRKQIVFQIDDLKNVFNGREPGGVAGVEFSIFTDPRIVGMIKTNFGAGRFVLEWFYNGTGLSGKIIVERERFDNRDRPYWQPVYSFVVEESGGWTRGNPSEQLPQYFTRDHVGRVHGLGCSVLHAILNGPVTV